MQNVYWLHASVYVCLSVVALSHYCTDPDVTWRNGRVPPSCALLGRLATGAQVSLLRQHGAEHEMSVSDCTCSTPG